MPRFGLYYPCLGFGGRIYCMNDSNFPDLVAHSELNLSLICVHWQNLRDVLAQPPHFTDEGIMTPRSKLVL